MIRKETSDDVLSEEAEATLLDIEALASLGLYYASKFQAALDLVRYERTGAPENRLRAIGSLEDATCHWRELARIAALQYLPYRMVRSKYHCGWGFYSREVEDDVRIARSIEPG